MHIITSLQLQKEINLKTNKTSKLANHLNQWSVEHICRERGRLVRRFED